ncbi:MAG: DEAD/DEAH box helicase family protein [Bacteroidetes bacterium]|nr:DEAD/DEAH box helicase family protein [Bacteroidota bacterium]
MRSTKYGQTWWGGRWLQALSHIDYSNRLPRGRSYANKGAVKDLLISKQRIIANVQGTRVKPYKVTVGIPEFTTTQKETLTDVILNNPLLLSKLLNRQLPESLYTMAESHYIRIFPGRWDDLEMKCSCPDWAVPCKHLAAVINVIANEIDRNPFLIFKLHGYDIIKTLRSLGIEAISETVSIPDLASLAVTEPVEQYQTEKTMALDEIDFSVLEDMREKLLSLLTEKPVFYSKDFKAVLDKCYRKTARKITRENFMTSGISHVPDHLASHYEKYSGVMITLDECSRLTDSSIQGEPGGSWRIDRRTSKEGAWHFRDGSDILRFISEIEARQVKRLSPGLTYLYMVYHFSRKLTETSSYIPRLLHISDGGYTVQWIPALMNQKIHEIFQSLEAAFPSAEELQVNAVASPKKEQLSSLVSFFVARFIQDGMTDKRDPRDMVFRIFFENISFAFNRPGEGEIPSSIQRWIDRYFMTHQAYTPVFEIFEKEESGRFGLKVLVEDSRQPLKEALPLSDVMTLPEYKSSRYEVLRSIELLTPSMPDLEFIISTSGRHIPVYTPSEFARVMFSILPAIRLYGIRVMLPDQLKSLIRPAASVALSGGGSVKKGSFLNLEKILSFQWKIALADTLMDAEEFFSMVKGLSGIVKIRDRYLYLDTAELKTLMEQMQQQDGKMGRDQLLQAAFTGELNGEKVSIDKATRELIDELLRVEQTDLPTGLEATLRPYQQRGFDWLYKNATLGFGSIIADDMGLGKTLQVIVLLLKLKEEGALDSRQALIVVPTTLLTNWKKEFEKFAPGITHALFHGPNRTLDDEADVILSSYGVVRSDQEQLSKKRWTALIIDEAQNIKNVDAAQTRAVKTLKSNIRVAMSGTPVENRLSEYWSIFDFIYKGYMGNLKKFTKEYAYPIEVNRNKKRLDRFLKITAPFILRRLKTDKSIISDLPDKIENDYMATLVKEQGALYQGVLNTLMSDIEEIEPDEKESGIKRRGMVLKLIMALKQVCNHPSQYLKKSDASPELSGKAGMLLDMLENILENNEKVLIFTQFREMGKILQQMIQDRFGSESMFLHGGCTRKSRDEMVERFQNDAREKIFLLSIKAGGTGLNLTAASHVIHYDLWWNPAVETQATDRAYRIGQNKNVMVYRLITIGTFEEKINAMLKEKKELADLTVSAGEKWVGELSNRDLKAMFSIT